MNRVRQKLYVRVKLRMGTIAHHQTVVSRHEIKNEGIRELGFRENQRITHLNCLATRIDVHGGSHWFSSAWSTGSMYRGNRT